MFNILTFDVEDWYQGLNLPLTTWADQEKRLGVGLEIILDLLAEYHARATFFVLGVVAQEHPQWVQRIAQAGHEIGTHGWRHTPLYHQTPAQFRTELGRSVAVLQDLTGQPLLGHRAAFFSLTPRTPWAVPELAAQVRYDSSVFPVWNYRYGWPNAPRWPHRWAGQSLWEFPLSTLRAGGCNVPFSGGFYARFWPYAALRWGITQLNQQHQPAIVYFHPWEFDVAHPRVTHTVPWLARLTHYHQLGRSVGVLRALLQDFAWVDLAHYYYCYNRES